MIKKFENFNDKDAWWDKNYNRLIDFAVESPNAAEIIKNETDEIDAFENLNGKNMALMLLHYLSIGRIEQELSYFEGDGE